GVRDDRIFVCRRGDDSGTQRATSAYFTRQFCGGGNSFRAPSPGQGTLTTPIAWSDNPPGSASVFALKGTGDVLNCLDDFDDRSRWAIGLAGTDQHISDATTLTAGGVTRIGHYGAAGGDAKDNLASVGTLTGQEAYTRELRFIAIDGGIPSLEVAANGAYHDYAENACYERTSAPGGCSA